MCTGVLPLTPGRLSGTPAANGTTMPGPMRIIAALCKPPGEFRNRYRADSLGHPVARRAGVDDIQAVEA